jgi:hypothetical protein
MEINGYFFVLRLLKSLTNSLLADLVYDFIHEAKDRPNIHILFFNLISVPI